MDTIGAQYNNITYWPTILFLTDGFPQLRDYPLYRCNPNANHCFVAVPISTVVSLQSQCQSMYRCNPNTNHCIVAIQIPTIVSLQSQYQPLYRCNPKIN